MGSSGYHYLNLLTNLSITQTGANSHYMPSELIYIGHYIHDRYFHDFGGEA